ncbi:MAG TPA: hypothetical protein VI789_04125 [Dehalococcoidia bacterium]|nr:hypothetical protein [Dehalococcoidia bacterium]
MALRTWVARFVVENGRVTEEGGRLRTFQRRRLDEPDVDLHLLLEPKGAKGEELGAQALDAIGRLFLQDRLSLTGGVIRALQGTHHTLQDWNRRSLPGDQVSAGIAAAAVSGPVVYFAQAGPGLAFLRQGGVLRRLEPADAALSPLGEGELEPALHRFELAPGDLLVAASPTIERILDQSTLEAILDRGSEEALPELYLLTRDLPNFALFAVTCSEEPDDDAQTEEEAGLPADPDLAPAPPAAGREADLPSRPNLLDANFSATGPQDRETIEPPASAAALPRRPLPSLGEVPAPEPAASPPAPEPAVINGPPPLDISRPVVRLRSDQSIGRSDYARTTGSPRRLRINLFDAKLLRLGAAAVFILLVIAFVPGLVKEGRSEKLGDLVVGAQTQLATSTTSADPAERRRLLEDTRRLASEALRIDSNNTAAAALRDQAAAAIKTLDAVIDLGPLTSLATLSRQVTGDIALEALVVANNTAFLLDTKGGRVLAVPSGGGQAAIVYQDGESYGGTPAKKPLYLTWEGNASSGRLLVLDTERKLFEVRPGSQPAPLALRRSNTWSSVAGIATYDGNLYVLDPRGNQVHRYLPAATGFDSEPTAVLTGSRDLASAQGIAVDADIFVFLKDGRVRRFRGGNDMDFPLGGIDRALKAPTDIAIVSGSEEIFLADSGNKRVVVANKDGNYRRQFVSNSFTDLRALALDATGAQLYVIVGDTLLATTLPH